MSLQLILGNSGSGKSHYLYEEIIRESMENPKTNYIIIVPEQFTMQTQKQLVSMHPNRGILNIDILSFQRLAYRVFDETGGNDRRVLEDTGKNLVLRRVAGEKQGELKILGSNLKKLGYINEIKSVISELTQYNVSLDELDGLIKKTSDRPMLESKLSDIRLLYNGFKEYLSDKYITAEEILDLLCDVIGRSDIIKNSVIAIDGFTGFTPIQNKLLERLMQLSKKAVVTVTIDAQENPYEMDGEHCLFHLSKKTIWKLCRIAEEAGIKKEEDIVLGREGSLRYRDNPPLSWLEQNLFRYSGRVFSGSQDSLSIHMAKNPYEECKFAGREIKRLVREKGMRYKEIAVVTGDIGTYSHYIENSFGDFDIPCFIDHKRSVLQNPFIEFIRAVLELLEKDYSYETMFRYLRSGLSGISEDEIDVLENYVIALGIRGHKAWGRQWTRTYRGFNPAALERINENREAIANTLEPLRECFRNKEATVKDFTLGLYEFIVGREMQQQLREFEEGFKKDNELALAKEYSQIYGIVMELFDKLAVLLGDEKITLREFSDILDAGFEEAKVGVIPPSVDQVIVGDIERTRLKEIKAMFFIGVNDGIIPKSGGTGGIISELDREILAGQDVELAPTARQNAFIQKYYLYLNLTKPTDYLYMTFSKVSAEGKSLRPSYLIGTMCKMYPDLEIVDEDECQDPLDRVVTAESGLDYLIEGLRTYRLGGAGEDWKELYSWYFKKEEWRPVVSRLVESAFHTSTEKGISKAVALALYGSTLENSVTRLEKYAACAFAHFLNYGLELSERMEYTFEPMDMGNIFHKTLELFSKSLENSGKTWFEIPDDERDAMVERAVDTVTSEDPGGILYSTARNRYMIKRMKRIMKRTVWALGEQVKAGKFTPGNFEVSFSKVEDIDSVNIALSEGEKMKLRGKIDRVDVYKDEDNVYVKVIDYKSGSTAFDLLALYHGLQLQLVVYLNAASEVERQAHPDKNIIPAGIFYYNMQDPILDREDGDTPEAVSERIKESLRMNGLVNSDTEVIRLLDEGVGEKSAVIPVGYNKNGSLKKSSSVASEDQFKLLSNYVNHKIREIGTEILDGHTEIEPYELADKKACEYCAYNAVCGFDLKVPGYRFRRLKKEKPEDIWKKIEEQETAEPGGEE